MQESRNSGIGGPGSQHPPRMESLRAHAPSHRVTRKPSVPRAQATHVIRESGAAVNQATHRASTPTQARVTVPVFRPNVCSLARRRREERAGEQGGGCDGAEFGQVAPVVGKWAHAAVPTPRNHMPSPSGACVWWCMRAWWGPSRLRPWTARAGGRRQATPSCLEGSSRAPAPCCSRSASRPAEHGSGHVSAPPDRGK